MVGAHTCQTWWSRLEKHGGCEIDWLYGGVGAGFDWGCGRRASCASAGRDSRNSGGNAEVARFTLVRL